MSKLKRRLNFCIVVGLLFCVNAAVAAQTLTITGTVTDNNGETLPGVNIRIQGTSTGVVSTVDGTYSILVSDAQSVLEFSFVGYSTVTAVVGDRRVIDVTLQEGQELEELVVIGYGTVRKSDVTGAVFRVGESTIKEKPVQNALQAIQGKAPGVDITSNLRPGEMGEIRIRGERSITASNEPLYVLDGIPMISGNITDINPNDIASIEILKDASATAIYGSRGANGVVLVTMKSGAKGRVSIDYDGTVTFSNIHSLTDWMNSGERLDWQRQGYLNGGTYSGAYGTAPDPARDFSLFMNGLDYMKRILATAYTLTDNDPSRPVLRAATAEEQARGYAAQVPVYDASKLFDQHWTDLVLRTGVTQNHQLSLSSGTDNSRLYLSLGYLDQNSPMKDQDYSRYTVNLRGDITPKKWLTIGLSANASYGVQNYGMNNGSMNGGAQDSYGQALNLAPYAPAFDENGKLFTPEVGQGQMSYHNVASNITQAWYEVRAYSVLANTFAEVRFTPWLRYRMNFGSQFRARRSGYYYGPEFTNPIGAVNTQQETGQYNLPTHFSWVVENLLYADKTFGVHTFGATLLQSAQKQRSENITIRSLDLTFPSAMFYSLQNNKTGNPYNDWGTNLVESQLMSYMVRLNYGLMNKYLLTVTGRWDGASVLAEGHKWDFFPSAALAWKMEQEEFIKNVDVISQLKLRLGYGVTGNSAVAAYSTGGSIYKNNYSFGKIPAAAYKSNVMPNKDLTWEKTAQVNIGLD
ncbi:MAG: SusC/RagA family TonB-linked outer membrane protein, partial [Bacteroidales bacterium]|nr:SusC/RagA family TonB-linked outer membrane protein [Bacteroidales bacterium]